MQRKARARPTMRQYTAKGERCAARGAAAAGAGAHAATFGGTCLGYSRCRHAVAMQRGFQSQPEVA
jgi:hypothetical protein